MYTNCRGMCRLRTERKEFFHWDKAEFISVNEFEVVESDKSSALTESQSALEYNHTSLLTLLIGLDDHLRTTEMHWWSEDPRGGDVEHDCKSEWSEM